LLELHLLTAMRLLVVVQGGGLVDRCRYDPFLRRWSRLAVP